MQRTRQTTSKRNPKKFEAGRRRKYADIERRRSLMTERRRRS
jgi:hypothetical protein